MLIYGKHLVSPTSQNSQQKKSNGMKVHTKHIIGDSNDDHGEQIQVDHTKDV